MVLFATAIWLWLWCTVSLVKSDCGTTPNVQTVLFTKHDVQEKVCWSRADINLAFARYLMQDLLPRKFPANVTYLNQYITLCVNTIHDLISNEDSIEMMMDALQDTMGGYLQAYGLPLAKEAYYEGIIDLDSVRQLYNTQHCFKAHLKTNGRGWMSAVTINKRLAQVTPMKLHRDKSHNYCKDLILKHIDTKTEKYYCPLIPMPFFDDCKNPRAIAIPFAQQSLHSLKSNQSQSILSRYYEVSINCIHSIAENKIHLQHCIKAFNKRISDWIKSQLMVHLQSSEWYPAFHGILRVLRTADKSVINGPKCLDYVTQRCANDNNDEDDEISTIHFAIIVALLLTLFWLIIAVAVLCRYCCMLGDGINECHQQCDACKKPEHCSPTGARLFTYNLSCWTKTSGRSSSSVMGKCLEEPNYVEIERYSSETSIVDDSSSSEDLQKINVGFHDMESMDVKKGVKLEDE